MQHNKFIMHFSTAETLLRFRDVIWAIARYYVVNNVDERWYDVDDSAESDTNNIAKYRKEMLDVLANLLSSASSKIDAVDGNSEATQSEGFDNYSTRPRTRDRERLSTRSLMFDDDDRR